MLPNKKASETLLGFVGKIGSMLIENNFDNLTNVKNLKCPLFILHGRQDELLEITHSENLYRACTTQCQLVLVKDMSHSLVNIRTDFILPFIKFLSKIDAMTLLDNTRPNLRFFRIPKSLYATPDGGPRSPFHQRPQALTQNF